MLESSIQLIFDILVLGQFRLTRFDEIIRIRLDPTN